MIDVLYHDVPRSDRNGEEDKRTRSKCLSGFASQARADALVAEAVRITENEFSEHPFADGISAEMLPGLLADYARMSIAFPYIQAAAIGRVYADRTAAGDSVTLADQATVVVGSFLVWDEFGGHAKVLEGGNEALPSILRTGNAFHGNLLLDDCVKILGGPVEPSRSPSTLDYLHRLERGLSSTDVVERTAHMVAFEHHAGEMIAALWGSVASLYRGDPDELVYFRTHVGGDDPAEAYHVAMTARLIGATVPDGREADFLRAFCTAYRMNVNWCQSIKAEAEVR